MQTREITTTELKGGAYLALPEGKGPHPGVVVIHEAFGLNDHMRDVARRFAAEGYAALAVDLFSGRNRAICMARYMTGMLLGSVNRYGINDLKGIGVLAIPPEEIIAGCERNLRAVVDELRRNGVPLILLTVLPVGPGLLKPHLLNQKEPIFSMRISVAWIESDSFFKFLLALHPIEFAQFTPR